MAGNWLSVGKVVNTHGIRGEVKLVPHTDFPDVRFRKGGELVLLDPSESKSVPVTVETARLHKNVYIVKFAGFDDINQVEPFKGWAVKVDKENRVELAEDEYYYHDIIGCKVVSEEGEPLGTITDILSPGANDVWVVKREKGRDLLVPVIDDVLLDVDVADKLVTIRLLEGMAD